MAKILIVEDEESIREMAVFMLEQQGFDCSQAGSAKEARIQLYESDPALILMDWMLPDESGINLTQEFKNDALSRDIPIIMLTARGEDDDKVRGFECGADDYVTKPFSPRELVARIQALLRRSAPHKTEQVVVCGVLQLDPGSHRVLCQEKPIKLGPTEFKLLHYLMTHPEKVYSRSQLLDRIWGTDVYVEERTVDVHVRRLRKALEPYQIESMVQTVRGAGYRFSEQANH
jgi:two-component system phosphate regulon response regulator PhoB